jgi:hypothetical protein
LGYQVTQVADEKVPPRPRAASPKVHISQEPAPEKTYPVGVWGAIAAAGFLIVGLTAAVIVSQRGVRPAAPPPNEALAQPPMQAVNNPREPQVILPEEAAAEVQEKERPAAKEKGLRKGRGGAKWDKRNARKKGDALTGRETFGTAVAFARNPREAARSAEAEGKLTFLLHVSGNFEEARFT